MNIGYSLSVIEPGAARTTERRFQFNDETTAWDAYVRAVQAGFEAVVERVERRERVPA